jgi:putative ABC transport system substrate-binding protein
MTAMPTIGFLNTLSQVNGDHLLAAFAKGVKDGLNRPFAYIGAGHDVPNLAANEVFICTRWADGNFDNLSPLAKELKSLVPAPKVIAGTGGIRSAKAAETQTKTIPIVFISGREITNEHDDHTPNAKGVYLATTPFSVETLPGYRDLRSLGIPASEIFCLVNKKSKVNDDEKDWTNHITVTNSDLDGAFTQIMQLGNAAGGLLISADPFFHDNKAKIVAFANNVFQKPVAYPFSEYVAAGGLMSAGVDLSGRYGAIGTWAADIINKGLSVKQLGELRNKSKAKRLLVVNRGTANSQLDKAKRSKLLGKADKVISTARPKRAR